MGIIGLQAAAALGSIFWGGGYYWAAGRRSIRVDILGGWVSLELRVAAALNLMSWGRLEWSGCTLPQHEWIGYTQTGFVVGCCRPWGPQRWHLDLIVQGCMPTLAWPFGILPAVTIDAALQPSAPQCFIISGTVQPASTLLITRFSLLMAAARQLPHLVLHRFLYILSAELHAAHIATRLAICCVQNYMLPPARIAHG